MRPGRGARIRSCCRFMRRWSGSIRGIPIACSIWLAVEPNRVHFRRGGETGRGGCRLPQTHKFTRAGVGAAPAGCGRATRFADIVRARGRSHGQSHVAVFGRLARGNRRVQESGRDRAADGSGRSFERAGAETTRARRCFASARRSRRLERTARRWKVSSRRKHFWPHCAPLSPASVPLAGRLALIYEFESAEYRPGRPLR